jgi:diaminohydroxyphosphoribosylaminopyrimidine deaminase/5-amino-6-(5-phosphoribosylamino)uracil reductase
LIDLDLKVPAESKIFDDEALTMVYNTSKEGLGYGNVYVKVSNDKTLPQQIAKDLYHRHIQSIIIEGGAYTLTQFINAGLWDEGRIFTSPTMLNLGINAPQINGTLFSEEKILDDTLTIKFNNSL